MPAVEGGFADEGGLAGSAILAAIGPTLPVYVGFDNQFGAGLAREPDYPIKQMRTGQFVPGQGDLWSVTIVAP